MSTRTSWILADFQNPPSRRAGATAHTGWAVGWLPEPCNRGLATFPGVAGRSAPERPKTAEIAWPQVRPGGHRLAQPPAQN